MDKKIDKSQLRRESMVRLVKWGIAVIVVVAVVVWTLSSIATDIKSGSFTLSAVDEGPLETTAPESPCSPGGKSFRPGSPEEEA